MWRKTRKWSIGLRSVTRAHMYDEIFSRSFDFDLFFSQGIHSLACCTNRYILCVDRQISSCAIVMNQSASLDPFTVIKLHKIPTLPARMNLDNRSNATVLTQNFHYTFDEFVTLLLPPSLDRSWNGWNHSLSFELSLLRTHCHTYLTVCVGNLASCKRDWESLPCNLRVKLVQ